MGFFGHAWVDAQMSIILGLRHACPILEWGDAQCWACLNEQRASTLDGMNKRKRRNSLSSLPPRATPPTGRRKLVRKGNQFDTKMQPSHPVVFPPSSAAARAVLSACQRRDIEKWSFPPPPPPPPFPPPPPGGDVAFSSLSSVHSPRGERSEKEEK